MIRPATHSDIPTMTCMGAEFIAASGTGLPFNADYVASSLRVHIGGAGRFAVVLDLDGPCGMLCAVAARSPLAPVAVASELVFWIDPPYRGRWALKMLRAYAEWARELGCVQASMVALASNPMDRLYAKAGFMPAEITYSMVL